MGEELRGGRYVVLGSLGDGAQGQTFDGVDRREGRPVAIKRFDVRGARAWKDVELAEREARVLQSLVHPKLPRYVDHFEQDGVLYLVMEKIEGESLASIRARGARLDEEQVIRLLRDASDVLDYLHGRQPPVIHRDLKPGNVIRRPDGSFAFVDFGAVRDTLRPRGGSTIVGTFGYMAPEQFQGRALPASDVYAVGATALTMMTGSEPENLPHRGLSIDVHAAIGNSARAPLVDALERMLEIDPDERAARIAPLLPALQGGRSASGVQSSFPPGAGLEAFEQYVRGQVDRAAWRHARRAEREAWKQARRVRAAWQRDRRGRPVPWPASFFFTVAFAVATVAVLVATQVVVPLVLELLALFMARPALRNAAARVRVGGRVAVRGIGTAREWLRSSQPPPAAQSATPETSDAAHTRVADQPGPRSRVAREEPEEDSLADEETSRRREEL
jgi:hypothetical protein